jgi:DNA polymerase III epsilon subunit-like protein
VHQISDDDLAHAPRIADALREAFEFVAGTVLVAHNFAFEEGFLTAVAQREDLPLPTVPGICTLSTSRRQLDGRGISLTVMYKTATGEFPINKHTALGEARAIRDVLLRLLRNSPQPLNLTAHPPLVAAATYIGECGNSCRPVPLSRSSVAELLASFPQSTQTRVGNPDEVEDYLALLAESVEDGLLPFEEAQALIPQACRTRLTGSQLRNPRQQAWNNTFPDEKNCDWMGTAKRVTGAAELGADPPFINAVPGLAGQMLEASAGKSEAGCSVSTWLPPMSAHANPRV